MSGCFAITDKLIFAPDQDSPGLAGRPSSFVAAEPDHIRSPPMLPSHVGSSVRPYGEKINKARLSRCRRTRARRAFGPSD
jgi:hypothetical protein